jgi:hypothetical protein
MAEWRSACATTNAAVVETTPRAMAASVRARGGQRRANEDRSDRQGVGAYV